MSNTDQVQKLLTADDRLDDITRARMWSRIEDRLEAPEAKRGSARRTVAIMLGAVATAATVLLVMRTFRAHDDHDLTVAADAMLTSRLGPHARAALVGPARLELLGPPGEATAARLHDGTLLAEFEGGAGRSLRIEAGDLTVEIVGTLFAIEVHDPHACVAVAHGTVRVTSHGTAQLVTDGQQLCSGELAPHAIPAAVSDQLARHERSIAIATERQVPAPTTPPEKVAAVVPVEAVAPPAPIAPPVTRASPIQSPVVVPPRATPKAIASTSASVSARAPEPRPSEPTSPPPVAQPAPTPAAPITPTVVTPTVVTPAPEAPKVPVVTPPPTAEALYHAAEVALAAGDRAAADRALARILAMPSSPLIDQALYERARIAYQNRAFPAARRFLATLATIASTPLAEPGRYLDCRIAVQARDADAERCFLGYRTAYPRSPHDLDVLAVLVQLAHTRAGCTGARTVRDELIARYPRTDHAAAWRSRCPEVP